MKRRINFTGRKRILARMFSVKPLWDRDGDHIVGISKETEIKLDELNLDPSGKIYIEVVRPPIIKAYEFGTVENPGIDRDIIFDEPYLGRNPSFRILVVDSESGRILAHARRLPEKVPTGRKSILPVELDDLGPVLWELRFTEEEGAPILALNRSAPGIKDVARRSVAFMRAVYPAVLREVLIRIFFIDGVDDIDNPLRDWHSDWIAFARAVSGTDGPGDIGDPREDRDSAERLLNWIDEEVVPGFSSMLGNWEDLQKEVGGWVA